MNRTLGRITIFVTLCAALIGGVFLLALGTANEALRQTVSVEVSGGLISGVSAESVLIYDLESGTEVFTRNAEQQRPIASVTKLLSSALFLEHAPQTEPVTITATDVQTEGRSGRLEKGQTYQSRELLFPALLESSNDATTAMARVAEQDLVSAMNAYVAEYSLGKTAFTDTSGLGDGNVSTAHELGSLVKIMHADYPHIFDITRLKTYLNHVNAWMNNNPFVNEEGYVGGKHGFTYAANRTAVALFQESLDNQEVRTFVYVLLGSDDLTADMHILRLYVQQSVLVY
ncbi:MAG: D-alanyl-D-alanine carboxypeptidase (penicillin-binding protein 5/6) [Patiriisocius sp.]|jgi:D-alanyl-D-alanine carboxypeptidase (penicillin-binding protein 5/6)